MRIEPLGESAFLLSNLEVAPFVMARSIEIAQLPGIEEVVPSIRTVGIYVDPAQFQIDSLLEVKILESFTGRNWKIPVMFDGSDLKDISRQCGVDVDEIGRLFCEPTYQVAAIGFLPGFPYLTGLPQIFSNIPRLAVPRIHVPAGSVAFAAGQAGIYPGESPGGWHLVGTTPLLIADPQHRYFPIEPGDQVKFHSVRQEQFDKLKEIRLTTYANS